MIKLSIYLQQRKEKIALAKAAQDKKKADYKAGRAFGVSTKESRLQGWPSIRSKY